MTSRGPRLVCNGVPIGNGVWQVEWSGARCRRVCRSSYSFWKVWSKKTCKNGISVDHIDDKTDDLDIANVFKDSLIFSLHVMMYLIRICLVVMTDLLLGGNLMWKQLIMLSVIA